MDASRSLTKARARAALEALRLGVVNRHVVDYVTYGRDRELERLCTVIEQGKGGSCQTVFGAYGVGKSHLCELVALRLEKAGYAVVHLELGAAHGKAESPASILQSIASGLTVTHRGHRISGNNIDALRRVLKPYNAPTDTLGQLLTNIRSRYPDVSQDILRYYMFLEEVARLQMGDKLSWYRPHLFTSIPETMTAINLATNQVVLLAHDLKAVGFRGIVLLFDEAERSEWAHTSYRLERAQDTILGFAHVGANADTSRLKHYMNSRETKYIPKTPSRIHTVFFFASDSGDSYKQATRLSVADHRLGRLSEEDRRQIQAKVLALYKTGYGEAKLTTRVERKLDRHLQTEEIRRWIRMLVGGLDYERKMNG